MHVIFAKPRGFCAGVDRAIAVVETALKNFGLPLYVKHAIVHNRHEVDRLRRLGVIFVERLSEIPEGSRVVFSAHGSPPESFVEARARRFEVIDAVCPLVTKVHHEVKRYAGGGRTVIVIGHRTHIEVLGTKGEAPRQTVVVESVSDAEQVQVPDPERVAYTTQTTLSVDDVREIVGVLKRRFPHIEGPRKADVCYATQNRQDAVKALAQRADLVLIFGSEESSNANRLVEVARREGVKTFLVEDASALLPEMFVGVAVVGVSSGASTPEHLIEEAHRRLQEFGAKSHETVTLEEEHVHFVLPKIFTR
ncbi:MAG: 4-hydroxy-3-methylbut-2-enyl diphosphate reductase [Candidatus Lloydbacteria bacterium RIFCSPHIGHO2_02_FULL_54_17]|uniref:4-hydroxy-3-methylbut-2-enyl diphosphate reductase n=1 Tax=Candidatus Lloydbacteria bacterium RIFCSPHIGHO2_02_FULL_54_17 TaxID=1798664 RepID=A0A1G2DAY3_9BACT|nr:MAG: 4-hydroxy-3-methylbut-2-enyl diphosphate reductase [Candidatus Lloydbacteria bacterium RIFCSPHIGHO2_01_FULL_54_11]OGZ10776.1 MAG: 4-hydroxy-3-methylbut-2-enyl diphosphate reductase [Candidatus Lloydbacteria bacterium RIFCSPHIGHO2_02_FULL_54_17]OGZ13077.1 MAG: 4-hydroxy-3-methylbut-2-enyl diphosphate reductase [Candidatus Lloydbacteria bacterium RIFCSPLOWO2_01_FULL_54_18]OGZ16524.1 MAG: 4-hydroxy-3-methylbut-2-enyl diphosphate reductase [Candidatus Lloydbacteria bacterium RIFCSPLOWO2_02_F